MSLLLWRWVTGPEGKTLVPGGLVSSWCVYTWCVCAYVSTCVSLHVHACVSVLAPHQPDWQPVEDILGLPLRQGTELGWGEAPLHLCPSPYDGDTLGGWP